MLTKVFNLQQNKWFILPWLISAVIFIYTLAYKSIEFWLIISTNVKIYLPLNLLIYTVAGEYSIAYG